jgi:UPF0716 protein FxsA
VILLLLFVVVPIAELYTIIRVGASIGFFNTLAVIIAVGFIGSWLVKREGMRTWVRFNQTLASGQIPAKEMVDGVLILGAGALLLTPGFLSDVFGILMLFPPTRAVLRGYVMKRVKAGNFVVRTNFMGGTSAPGRQGPIVDTDATEPKGEI